MTEATKATFTPAVTKTETIEVSPATVTLALTLDEAATIRALLGRTGPEVPGAGPWEALNDLSRAGKIPRLVLNRDIRSIRAVDFVASEGL